MKLAGVLLLALVSATTARPEFRLDDASYQAMRNILGTNIVTGIHSAIPLSRVTKTDTRNFVVLKLPGHSGPSPSQGGLTSGGPPYGDNGLGVGAVGPALGGFGGGPAVAPVAPALGPAIGHGAGVAPAIAVGAGVGPALGHGAGVGPAIGVGAGVAPALGHGAVVGGGLGPVPAIGGPVSVDVLGGGAAGGRYARSLRAATNDIDNLVGLGNEGFFARVGVVDVADEEGATQELASEVRRVQEDLRSRRRRKREDDSGIPQAENLSSSFSLLGGLVGSALGRYFDSKSDATVTLIDDIESLGLLALDQIDVSLANESR